MRLVVVVEKTATLNLKKGSNLYIIIFTAYLVYIFLRSHSSDYFPRRDPQNTILTELYDSLDKKSPPSKMDLDSLEINLNNQAQYSSDVEHNKNLFDSLETNLWSKEGCLKKNAAFMVENVLKKQTQVNEVHKNFRPLIRLVTQGFFRKDG